MDMYDDLIENEMVEDENFDFDDFLASSTTSSSSEESTSSDETMIILMLVWLIFWIQLTNTVMKTSKVTFD